jgi:hypothetical protein
LLEFPALGAVGLQTSAFAVSGAWPSAQLDEQKNERSQ